MKKLLAGLSLCVLAATMVTPLVGAQSFEGTILPWMFDKGLTMYDNVTDFRGADLITRGEFSKNLARFADELGLSKVKTASECQFNDLVGYDGTLTPTILQACEYGLVKGHEGNYYPRANLTEAEALTVAIRAIAGMQDETGEPRWRETWSLAEWYGITDGEGVWDLDTPATRETVGTRLYRTAHTDTDKIEDESAEELEEILEEIFGDDFFEEN